MSLVLLLLLSASNLDPIAVLARQGFRIRAFQQAHVAVSPAGDPMQRAEFLYDRYKEAVRRVEEKFSLKCTLSTVLVECATRRKFQDTLSIFLGRPPPRYAAAIALPRSGMIVLNRASFRPLHGQQAGPILIHEVAHLVLHKRFKRIPRWLDEGLSMVAADHQVAPQEALTLRYWASRRGIMPFSEIMEEFPREHRLVNFAYVQSHSIVSYLIHHKGGIGQIWRILDRYQSRSLRQAWKDVVGEEPEITWEKWRREEARKHDPFRFLLGEIPFFTYPAVLFLLAYARYRVKRRQYFKQEKELEREQDPQERYWEDAQSAPD